MPVFNGIELAKRIAQNNQVIFLTSTTDNEKLVINAINIVGYLNKPFDVNEFIVILKNKIVGKQNRGTSPKKSLDIQISITRDIRFKPESAYYITTIRNHKGEHPEKNCVHIYGKDDTLLFKNVRKSINWLYMQLEMHHFEKISQSTIINMSHIKERDNVNLELYDCGENFEIKSSFKQSIITKIRTALSKL